MFVLDSGAGGAVVGTGVRALPVGVGLSAGSGAGEGEAAVDVSTVTEPDAVFVPSLAVTMTGPLKRSAGTSTDPANEPVTVVANDAPPTTAALSPPIVTLTLPEAAKPAPDICSAWPGWTCVGWTCKVGCTVNGVETDVPPAATLSVPAPPAMEDGIVSDR